MLYLGKFKILKNQIDVCDYDYVLDRIRINLEKKDSLLISPIASQTLVRSYFDNNLKKILDKYDGLYPDSYWIKLAIYFLYAIKLKNRVYGPELMLRVCNLAQKNDYRIFLYGTVNKTLKLLVKNLKQRYHKIKIVGRVCSKFRKLTEEEKKNLIKDIEKAKADILMIGLGSPLEQIFAYELLYQKPKFSRPIVVIPFGAAFDFIARVKPQAPKWMQEGGVEWLFRLICEPKRLWRRYLLLGSLFISLVFLQKIRFLTIGFFPRLVALIIFTLCLPVFVFLYFIVRMTSPGPFIFRQKRVGKDGKIFTLYKIRTMIDGAEKKKRQYLHLNEADGPVFKIRNDPRYTKVGKFLAHTGLDELPQLVNVIKGEMAFVGPRPLPVEEASKIPTRYRRRFSVLPGMTSFWIIRGNHKLSFFEWMESDLEYTEKKSFLLDLKIIIVTIFQLLHLA